MEVTRAGAVSLFTDLSGVVLCGGRNGVGQVLGDCLEYNLTSHMGSHRLGGVWEDIEPKI